MNIANRITILRILIPALFLPALMTNMPYGKMIALFLFVLASISDWLDGYLARRYNIASDFGRLIDPLADKILVAAALVSFVAVTPGIVKAWMVVIIVSRDFLITGLRLLAAQHNTIVGAESIGKHKTAWQMIGIISVLVYLAYGDINHLFPQAFTTYIEFYAPLLLTLLFYVIVGLTLISGALYLWRYRSLYRRHV